MQIGKYEKADIHVFIPVEKFITGLRIRTLLLVCRRRRVRHQPVRARLARKIILISLFYWSRFNAAMRNYDYIEADDCYDMAVAWIRSGNIEKGVERLNRAIDLNPCFIYAYITLARAYALKKKYSDAVHALKRAAWIDPAFDRLHFLMAKYAYRNGDHKSALIFIERALSIDRKMLYELTKEFIMAGWPG